MFWKRRQANRAKLPAPVKRCSFCNKSARDVRKLVAGPGVNICNECVDICQSILDENRMLDDGQNTPEQLELDRARVESGAAMLCGLCGNLADTSDLCDVAERGKVCLACIEAVVASKPEVVH
jgi:hypothetical protein